MVPPPKKCQTLLQEYVPTNRFPPDVVSSPTETKKKESAQGQLVVLTNSRSLPPVVSASSPTFFMIVLWGQAQ